MYFSQAGLYPSAQVRGESMNITMETKAYMNTLYARNVDHSMMETKVYLNTLYAQNVDASHYASSLK